MSKTAARSALLAAALAAATATAHGTEGHRRHEAHVHGTARLEVAVEGADVHIGLISPAATLVGFEHVPATTGEREALGRALALLKEAGRLFVPTPGAECRPAAVAVHTPLDAEAGPSGDRDDDHGGGDPREPGTGPDHGQGHADVEAEYRFTCARPERLEGLDVTLFEAFPGTERLRAQYVTPRGQGGADLTPASHALRF